MDGLNTRFNAIAGINGTNVDTFEFGMLVVGITDKTAHNLDSIDRRVQVQHRIIASLLHLQADIFITVVMLV